MQYRQHGDSQGDDSGEAGSRPSAEECLHHPDDHFTAVQRRWLEPLGPLQRAARKWLMSLNRVAMRMLFRLRVVNHGGAAPREPLIIAPNHSSSLDGAVLFAALDSELLNRTRWIGREGAVLGSPLRRWLNRLAKSMPVRRDPTALAAASVILSRGENLVWFPEGSRTLTGELQPLKPGIGLLMRRFEAPVVPIYVDGAYQAMPPGRLVPRRLTPITVYIGASIDPAELQDVGLSEQEQADACVAAVEQALRHLRGAARSGGTRRRGDSR